jgi:hypothetical protein
MNVVLVEAAVLGDFGVGIAGEDHPRIDLEDDVGSARVTRRIVELVAQ